MYIIVEGINKSDTTRRCHAVTARLGINPIILGFPSDHCSSARATRHTLEFDSVITDEQREELIVKEFKLLNDYAQTLIAKGHSVIINGGPFSYLHCQNKSPDFTTVKKLKNILPDGVLFEKIMTPPVKIVGKSHFAKWIEKDENIAIWTARITEVFKMI